MSVRMSAIRRRAVKAVQEIAFSEDSGGTTKLSALKTLIELCDEEKSRDDTEKKLDMILAQLGCGGETCEGTSSRESNPREKTVRNHVRETKDDE